MFVVDPLLVSVALVLAYLLVAVLTFLLRLRPGLGREPETAGPLHSLP
jgi:hypothetical protein